MGQAIDDLNDEMVAAGVRVFVGGLHPGLSAVSVSSDLEVHPGPRVAAEEYIGGFWVLDVADEAEAVGWAKKAAVACRVPVEVRRFY